MSWPSGVAKSNTHLNTMTMYDDDEEEVGELEDDYDHNDGVLSHHVDSVLYISVWSAGVAQSNTHLNTMTVKDDDDGGGDNDEDDDVNDGVHSHATSTV